jgi:hypothetical protein
VRERLYDAACFLLTTREGGLRGEFTEPSAELSFANFMQPLLGKAMAIAATQEKAAPVTPPVIEYVEEPHAEEAASEEAAQPPDED